MATSIEFTEFVMSQIDGYDAIRCKKMFGEYMVYVNDKPVLLLCDNNVFVKILPETTAILGDSAETARPYDGAKPHYVVDPDEKETLAALVRALEKVTLVPKKKAAKKQ